VAPKDLIATIKIIPFSVPSNVLSVAEALARQGSSPLTLHPFRHLNVGLVVTELPGLKDSVTDKTINITEARVNALTGTLLPPIRCPHHEDAVGRSLDSLVTAGADLLLVIGASAVVDRRDVGPAGIVRAGGEILHFGMPVDPGNLICFGRIGERPALVLPGCARSPNLNGIDFVLTRQFAGVAVTSRDVMRMGVGGLLKEMETRPMPREKAPATLRSGAAPRSAPLIAAVILGAGRSRRMAPYNKLLLPDRAGKTMIARVVDNVLSSNAKPILVVTGHQAEQIEHALGGRPVRYVHAQDYGRSVGQPEGRDRGGAARMRRGSGVPGRHAAGDRADDRPPAVDVRPGRGPPDRVAHVPRQAGQPDAVGPALFPGDPADRRRFRCPVPGRQAHRSRLRGGDGRRRRAAGL